MTLAKSKVGRVRWVGLLTMASGGMGPSVIAAGVGDRPAPGGKDKAAASGRDSGTADAKQRHRFARPQTTTRRKR